MNPTTSTRRRVAALTALVAIAVLAASPSHADLTLHLKSNNGEQTIYLTGDMMRADDAEGIMIFDAKKQVMRVGDPSQRTYQEMTKKDLEAIAAMTEMGEGGEPTAEQKKMMEQARQQALESIKDLPEDQRVMAEREIERRFASMAGPPGARTFEPMKKTETVNGYKCEGYKVIQDGRVVGELWAASLDEIGMTKESLAVIGKLREFFTGGLGASPIAAAAIEEFGAFDPASESFIGFPVKRSDFEDGETTVLVSIDKTKLDGSVFEFSGDYAKAKGFMPGGE